MPQFSHSKLSTFEACPLQFRFKYIEKPEIEAREGIEAFMGSRVHEALEKLYTDLKHEKPLTEKDLIEFYNIEWKKQFTDDIVIVKDYTAENYRKMGEKALKTYYKRFKPFNQATTLATEKKISILLDKEGKYELVGYIDRLDKVDDGTYEIHDYKTSGTLPDQGHADSDRQLALYALAVRREFPDAKQIRLIWHYLIFGLERESERTEMQLEQLREETLALVRQVEKTEMFPARPSELCSWCEFQPICPEWSHRFKTEGMDVNEYRNEPGVNLVNSYAKLSDEKKEIDIKLEQIKDALFDYAGRENVNTVFGTDVKARLWQKEAMKLPDRNDPLKDELVRLLRLLGRFDEVSQLDTWELAKIIEEKRWKPEVLKQLEPFCRKETVRRVYLNKRD